MRKTPIIRKEGRGGTNGQSKFVSPAQEAQEAGQEDVKAVWVTRRVWGEPESWLLSPAETCS